MRIPLTPRLMAAAVIAAGVMFLVLLFSGLTNLAVEEGARADRAEHALSQKPPVTAPQQGRELDALLNLFAFCRENGGANWDDPRCAATPADGGSILDVLGNAPADVDDGDVAVTVRTEERTSPAPRPTTPVSQPTARAKAPDDSDNRPAVPVPDVAEPVDQAAKTVDRVVKEAKVPEVEVPKVEVPDVPDVPDIPDVAKVASR